MSGERRFLLNSYFQVLVPQYADKSTEEHSIQGMMMMLEHYRQEMEIERRPCRNSILKGDAYVIELLRGHPGRCHESLRMQPIAFENLCERLKELGLTESRGVKVIEQVAIFILTLSHSHTNRLVAERFQHSTETISRHFHRVLQVVGLLANEIIVPPDMNQISQHILNKGQRYYPFRNCVGAIDGTHIHAYIDADKAMPYRGRKGYPTQNVMAVCSFDMLFTYVVAGWEGSANDSRILNECLARENWRFPRPPEGRLGSNTRQAGQILINGCKQALAYGTSAYVTQDDTLITTLTVREAVYYSAQLQLPNSMSNADKKERAEMTIREMGLQDCMNTRIGGWGAKGISGGQKRRVSICIEILTRPKLLFLDEPTSGLDSAASYYVMKRIAEMDQQDGRTVVTSIHQPSSEVFGLFHNLCLLSSGRTVYFGPANGANQFFSVNGFPCPTLMNPADHFLRTINKDFDEDIELGSAGTMCTDEAINTLVNSYKSSNSFEEVGRQVAEICKQGGRALMKKNHANFLTQCVVLTRRSFVNMFRDIGYYWLRLGIYAIIALALGTIYYNVGSSYGSIQARGAMLMFCASFLTFMAIGGFPSFVEDMKVFERERLNGHYGSGAFAIGNTLSSMPFLLVISVIPGSIAYFLAGLQGGHEHFTYFVLIVFASTMLVESLMMIVASVVPNFLMGIITGAGLQGLLILGGGFFRLPNDLPIPFWRYPLYYIAFHKYAYQGLYKNEFEGLVFPNSETSLKRTLTGETILRERFQVEIGYSKWIDLAILLGMLVVYRLIFFIFVKMVEKVKPGIRALMSVAPKQKKQVMINPTATPLYEQSV